MAESEPATIARPYARAAFSFALDQAEGLPVWSRMLSLLSAALDEEIVRSALDNPLLSGSDEARLLSDILGDELTDQGRNFISVLAQYNRIALLPDIFDMYELLKANHEKTMEVEVTSAFEVTEEEKSALSEALNRMLKRNINLTTGVDQSLLGGVVIRAEDTVIDSSVKGKLQKLAHALD